ncbi:hypothetical protein T01_12991 [Trichinella spiralis]|uniref:Uncharacterized protein n=1 Tax=Trichinella spiralis TaxID=6334 RepID=A0A0V0YVL8_TRISP|nr:hypothetical protein T01_12991 [Trichinella spiralis]
MSDTAHATLKAGLTMGVHPAPIVCVGCPLWHANVAG